jgi:MFS family permease
MRFKDSLKNFMFLSTMILLIISTIAVGFNATKLGDYTPPHRPSGVYYNDTIYYAYQDFKEFNSDLILLKVKNSKVEERRVLSSGPTDALFPKVVVGDKVCVFWIEYDQAKKSGTLMFTDLGETKEIIRGDIWSSDAYSTTNAFNVAYINHENSSIVFLNLTFDGTIVAISSIHNPDTNRIGILPGSNGQILIAYYSNNIRVYSNGSLYRLSSPESTIQGSSVYLHNDTLAVVRWVGNLSSKAQVQVAFLNLSNGNQSQWFDLGYKDCLNYYSVVFWDRGWKVAFSSNQAHLKEEDSSDRDFNNIFLADVNESGLQSIKRITPIGDVYEDETAFVTGDHTVLFWIEKTDNYELQMKDITNGTSSKIYSLEKTQGRTIVFLPLAFGLLSYGIFVLIVWMLSNKKKEIPIDKTSIAPKQTDAESPTNRNKKAPFLKHYHDASSYLFLRWFFIPIGIVPMLWFFFDSPIASEEFTWPSNPLFRSFPILAGASVLFLGLSMIAVRKFDSEIGISRLHTVGYGLCLTSMLMLYFSNIFLVYFSLQGLEIPVDIQLIQLIILRLSLVMLTIGATSVLVGASDRHLYFIVGGLSILPISVFFIVLSYYYSGNFFPVAHSATYVLSATPGLPDMLCSIFSIMIFTLTLHDNINYELVKKPGEWSKENFQRLRLSGLAMALLLGMGFNMLLFGMALSFRKSPISFPFSFLGIAGAVVGSFLIIMWKTQINQDYAVTRTRSSLSKYIYNGYLGAISGPLIGLMLSFTFWALFIIGIILFFIQIIYFDIFIRKNIWKIIDDSKKTMNDESIENEDDPEEEERTSEPLLASKEVLIRLTKSNETTVLKFFGYGMIVVTIFWSLDLHHPISRDISGLYADSFFLILSLFIVSYGLRKNYRAVQKKGNEDILALANPDPLSIYILMIGGFYTFMLVPNKVLMILLFLIATVSEIYLHGYYFPLVLERINSQPEDKINVPVRYKLLILKYVTESDEKTDEFLGSNSPEIIEKNTNITEKKENEKGQN